MDLKVMSKEHKGVTCQKGFTLLELMVVVVIIGILASIAIPSYIDYMTQSKVAEGLTIASSGKTAVASYVAANSGTFPTNNSDAGLQASSSYQGNYVSTMNIVSTPSPGTIQITFGSNAGPMNTQSIYLVPSNEGGSLTWVCQTLPANFSYVPSTCRNAYTGS